MRAMPKPPALGWRLPRNEAAVHVPVDTDDLYLTA